MKTTNPLSASPPRGSGPRRGLGLIAGLAAEACLQGPKPAGDFLVGNLHLQMVLDVLQPGVAFAEDLAPALPLGREPQHVRTQIGLTSFPIWLAIVKF